MSGFLGPHPESDAAERVLAGDLADHGYVMGLTRLWVQAPQVREPFYAALDAAASAGGLSHRHKAVLVAATARAIGDSYCALAWGGQLAGAADEATAEAVLRGDDAALDPVDLALARWARAVATSPATTTEADLQPLRDAGLTDDQVFGATVFVALRQAFSAVNASLGAQPDAELVARLPEAVVRAVDWGRPPLSGSS